MSHSPHDITVSVTSHGNPPLRYFSNRCMTSYIEGDSQTDVIIDRVSQDSPKCVSMFPDINIYLVVIQK